MRKLYQQKRQEGFTIIEVLIVLAIAALILLIVFLAVPALQRNSRNNGTKNDAANLLAAVNDFEANNNGGLPNAQNGTGTITFTNGAAGVVTSEAKVQGATTVTFSPIPAAAPTAPANVGTIEIVTGWKCNGNAAYTASSRSVIAIFRIENGTSTNQPQCLES